MRDAPSDNNRPTPRISYLQHHYRAVNIYHQQQQRQPRSVRCNGIAHLYWQLQPTGRHVLTCRYQCELGLGQTDSGEVQVLRPSRLGVSVSCKYATTAFFAYFSKVRISHIFFPHKLAFSTAVLILFLFLLPISIRFRYLDHLVANRMALSMCPDPCGMR